MIIHAYTYVHNEEFMLPYWLRHYSRFCSKITVFDNESTDKTAEIAKAAGAQVIPVDTGGKHRVEILQSFMNDGYKASRGEADWVICAEGDEFFYYSDLPKLLERYQDEGVTFPKIAGFEMIAPEPPKENGQIWEELKNGVASDMYSKRGVFHPNIDINFGFGGHQASPKGNVVESKESEIVMLHYRYLGLKYFADRYQVRRDRISREDHIRGLGVNCLEDHEIRYKRIMENHEHHAKPVVP